MDKKDEPLYSFKVYENTSLWADSIFNGSYSQAVLNELFTDDEGDEGKNKDGR